MSSQSSGSGGVSFLGLLCLLFIGLRLGGVIDWLWVWVLAPIWIPMILALVLILIMGVVYGVCWSVCRFGNWR
jgi:hypothetical protein